MISHSRDVDVEEAVAIVVGDRRHAPPVPPRNAGLLGYVNEASLPQVVVEPVAALHRGHEQIRPAVVVVVEEYDPTGCSRIGTGESGGGGFVREGSIATASIESEPRAPREHEILAAVSVGIADRDARGLTNRVVGVVAEQSERGREPVLVHAVDPDCLGLPAKARLLEGHHRSIRHLLGRDLPERIEEADV